MDLHTALAVFTALEAPRAPDETPADDREEDYEPYEPPVYDVRLDASSDRNQERAYRIRVASDGTVDAHQGVIDLARAHGLSLNLENSALELR